MILRPFTGGPPPRDPRVRDAAAVLIAIIGHAVFLALLFVLSHVGFQTPALEGRTRRQPIALRGISGADWQQNRTIQDGARTRETTLVRPPPEPAKKPKPQEHPKGQVVDVAPGNSKENPNAKYLAESSNSVERESRAKDQSAEYRNAMPRRTSTTPHDTNGHDTTEQIQISGNNGRGQDDRPLRTNSPKAVYEVPDVKARSEVALKATVDTGEGAEVSNHAESVAIQGNGKRLLLQPGAQDGDEQPSQGHLGADGPANLMPSMAVLDKITGAAPNDHLSDVDPGEGTFLNTKEWKFASFFNRVKQSISHHWHPIGQLQLRDPSGQVYGSRDRYTVLSVTLDDRGHVVDVFVEKSSGLDFLDLEAVHSFERAQPFPNPPPGLVADDSRVRFSFGFFLEMSSSPVMRLFRSAN